MSGSKRKRFTFVLVGALVSTAGLGARMTLAQDGAGSIVAWGYNAYGQCDVPAPNTDFVAIAGGYYHSLGLKADGSIVVWGSCSNVPGPNTDFVAVAAGVWHRV